MDPLGPWWPQVHGAGQVGAELITHRWRPLARVAAGEVFEIGNPRNGRRLVV